MRPAQLGAEELAPGRQIFSQRHRRPAGSRLQSPDRVVRHPQRQPDDRASKQLFGFSVLYLFLLFAVLLVERGWDGLLMRWAA